MTNEIWLVCSMSNTKLIIEAFNDECNMWKYVEDKFGDFLLSYEWNDEETYCEVWECNVVASNYCFLIQKTTVN